MKLQVMIDNAKNVADWIMEPGFVFERTDGYVVVDSKTAEKLKEISDYKFRAVVYPKPK